MMVLLRHNSITPYVEEEPYNCSNCAIKLADFSYYGRQDPWCYYQ